jgi:hypothetical protein
MNPTLTALEHKEAVRLKLLKVVYERNDGDPEAIVDVQDILSAAGLSPSEGRVVVQYLLAEELLRGHGDVRISITHAGVKEIEAALRGRGSADTQHFSQAAIRSVIPDGSVQAADRENAAVNDSVSREPSGDLSSLLAQLREHASVLPERDREVALEHVVRLQHAASSEKPDTVRMKVWLKGLEAFAPLIPVVGRVLDALSDIGV